MRDTGSAKNIPVGALDTDIKVIKSDNKSLNDEFRTISR